MKLFRRIRAWLRGKPVDPAALQAAQEAEYDRETLKTGALEAPPMMQGEKWRNP